jgi:flagellar basal body-associated protein FliL
MSETVKELKAKQSKTPFIILGVILVVALTGGGYYYYTTTQKVTNAPQAATSNARGNRGGNNANATQTSGKISSINNKQLVIDDTNNNQVLVTVADSTRITKSTAANLSDVLAVNNFVTVQTNQDGSTVTALTVNLQPAPTQNGGTNGQQPGQGGRNFNGGSNPGGNNGQNPNRGPQNRIIGQITSIDGKTVKVKGFNNNESSFTVTDSTKYTKTDPAAITDLATGQNVQINSTLSGGINNARSISIES